MKNIRIILTICLSILFFTCKENPSEPEPIKYDKTVLGKIGQTRTYYTTVAIYNPGTQTPFLIPPTELKNKIQYPDSLIVNGICSYETENEKNILNGDTLIINSTGEGHSLFSEILNESLNNSSDGWFGSEYKSKYILNDNKIYEVFQSGDKRLKYDLPLSVGKTYITEYEVETISIIGEQKITTRAGTFDVLKIQVVRKPNLVTPLSHAYEIIYFKPNVGIILYESLQLYSTNTPTDITHLQIVDRYQRKELISIN
ncbi:MAG: hypothetical protein Q8L01_03640 [Candidatus Woesebacteria bacterium]|nr:hypothetical protein [Candidatus Woesebacteria bacterium]